MTPGDLIPLSPPLWVGLGAVLVLLQASVRRNAVAATGIASASLLGALLSLAWIGSPGEVTPLLIVDPQTRWYWGVLLGCGLAVALLLHDYLGTRDEHVEEAQALVLLATLGACLLAGAVHFASVFLGFEILSVALFPLLAYVRRDPLGAEAATKYLVLAATSSAFLLLGGALAYAGTGSLGLAALQSDPSVPSGLAAAGAALVLVGLGFKLAVVPFHLWTPDVYQGAPAPVTALVATVSKGAAVAALARWALEAGIHRSAPLGLTLAGMAGASILVGNLLALGQDNVKRMLAYSSIAHVGYLLVALIAGGEQAAAAVGYYLAAYAITSIGAFGAVSMLSQGEGQAEDLAAYRGLFWRHPWIAGLFTASLLSLAGVPLTAGFLAKLLVIGAGVDGAAWVLLSLLVLGSVVGLFYYLRVVATMFQAPEGEALAAPTRSPVGWASIGLATIGLLALGTVPAPFMGLLAGW